MNSEDINNDKQCQMFNEYCDRKGFELLPWQKSIAYDCITGILSQENFAMNMNRLTGKTQLFKILGIFFKFHFKTDNI